MELLRRYFYSGWAFLMPYLVAYMLYYVARLPVNAVASAAEGVRSQESGVSILSPIASHPSPIPCLLHVYWVLHAIHVILAGVALWSWWASYRSKHQGPSTKCQSSAGGDAVNPTTDLRPLTSDLWPLASGFSSIAVRLAPWALLALIFYIPGVYLEWPSDPWEHLRRINEWRILETVGAHSSWMKSSYFISYSFLSWCIGLRQLFWLDFYYTGICLLLCWQYYRFSRACGLGECASMVFVIIQALLFGNNIFSFYRYYGISSSIYAQLGAIALTRVFLEWAARGTRQESSDKARQCVDGETRGLRQAARPEQSGGLSERVPTGRNDNNSRSNPTQRLSPIAQHPSPQKAPPLAPGFWHWPSVFWLLISGSCLLALTALNHPQGLGIAGLGIAAVCIWRLIEWKRSALWWLIGVTIIVNALFIWLYPRPAIIETYRSQGWLNAWYGFNILNLTSPAGDRMLQIVSIFGLINLSGALLLLRRNQVTAWLTITPFFILMLPCISIPLAYALSRHGDPSNIVTFQRLLFTAPFGLCAVVLGGQISSNNLDGRGAAQRKRYKTFLTENTCFSFLALAVAVNANVAYSRFWHANAVTPRDLKLFDIVESYEAAKAPPSVPTSKVITTQAGAVLQFFTPRIATTSNNRTIGLPAVAAIAEAMETLGQNILHAPKQLNTAVSRLQYPTKATPLNLVSDPDARDPSSWINLGGHPPVFIDGIADLATSSTALENPTGLTSLPFSDIPIPIDRSKSYRIEMKIRQKTKTDATVYLAVAWYDSKGKLLVADQPKENGAGNPPGWTNGTYSYFGLLSQIPPLTWKTFGISFGLNEAAEIPRHARWLRVGALLNNNGTPLARIQLTDIQFYEIPTPAFSSALPVATSTYSPASLAGILSGHWPPQQVNIDRGGSSEIASAALRQGQASANTLCKNPASIP